MLALLLALSGNVTTAINLEGDLVLTGDALDNHIQITERPDGKALVPFSGTTINGSADPYFYGTLRRNLVIYLGDGHDSVFLDEINVYYPTEVTLGNGEDIFFSMNSTITGDFLLDTGADDDYVYIQDSKYDNSILMTGEGDDYLEMFAHIMDFDTVVNMGYGADHLRAGFCLFKGNTRFNGGPGIDWFQDDGDNRYRSGPPKIVCFESAARSR